MASTNQSPFYQKAEAKFLSAQTDEERLIYLEEMIRECPKHKSSEKMLAQLKTRYKKFKEKLEKSKKSGKGTKEGIKKEGVQTVIVGMTNTGKSSLISLLTNTKPLIADYDFTTKKPVVGMLKYKGIELQLIEIPAFESEYYDRGLVHTADIILLLVTNMEQIKALKSKLDKEKGKQIVVFNEKNKLTDNELRKIKATLESKRYNFVIVDLKNPEEGMGGWEIGSGLSELKEKLLQSSGKIRVYTKEPGKNRSDRPIVLNPDSTVKQVAEKILHGFLKNIKETKIWGPSSKFPGQKVGLNHKLKDLDVVEFKTR